MTPKQISLVERIIPYVEYMLARRIPYVPPRLWDDCRSIAYMSLCEYVAKQDDEDASWVSEFAFKRMKDAVIKFLVSEKSTAKIFPSNKLPAKATNTSRQEKIVFPIRLILKSLSHLPINERTFKKSLRCLKKGTPLMKLRERHISRRME